MLSHAGLALLEATCDYSWVPERFRVYPYLPRVMRWFENHHKPESLAFAADVYASKFSTRRRCLLRSPNWRIYRDPFFVWIRERRGKRWIEHGPLPLKVRWRAPAHTSGRLFTVYADDFPMPEDAPPLYNQQEAERRWLLDLGIFRKPAFARVLEVLRTKGV